jgi:hypothetical protein
MGLVIFGEKRGIVEVVKAINEVEGSFRMGIVFSNSIDKPGVLGVFS